MIIHALSIYYTISQYEIQGVFERDEFFEIIIATFPQTPKVIIYENIKTRYNVLRKYANDVFGEYDFMVQKLPKSYIIRLLEKHPALKLSQSLLTQRNDVFYKHCLYIIQ